ncbi:hypothetical protein BSPWISOXPB_2499, partial [uncultured Gammaproteobacteria bacterium]
NQRYFWLLPTISVFAIRKFGLIILKQSIDSIKQFSK